MKKKLDQVEEKTKPDVFTKQKKLEKKKTTPKSTF